MENAIAALVYDENKKPCFNLTFDQIRFFNTSGDMSKWSSHEIASATEFIYSQGGRYLKTTGGPDAGELFEITDKFKTY